MPDKPAHPAAAISLDKHASCNAVTSCPLGKWTYSLDFALPLCSLHSSRPFLSLGSLLLQVGSAAMLCQVAVTQKSLWQQQQQQPPTASVQPLVITYGPVQQVFQTRP